LHGLRAQQRPHVDAVGVDQRQADEALSWRLELDGNAELRRLLVRRRGSDAQEQGEGGEEAQSHRFLRKFRLKTLWCLPEGLLLKSTSRQAALLRSQRTFVF